MLTPVKVRQGKRSSAAAIPPHSNLTWQFFTSDSGSNTSFTFSSMNLGTPAADRWVIVVAGGNTNFLNPFSVTVAGQAATKIVELGGIGMWAALVPSGTSGNIVVAFASPETGCTMGYWTVNMASGTPTFSTSNTGGASATASGVIVPAGGFSITSSIEYSGTNLEHTMIEFDEMSETFDGQANRSISDTFFIDFETQQGPFSVTSQWSGGSSSAIVLAVWQ